MKFTLSWLKDHLETSAGLDDIVATLTKIGLEVERIENKGASLKDFVIAQVVSAEKHPNADKLKLCMVETGAGKPVQVVCGAPNAREGMKSVFAPPGTFIPGKNFTLEVGIIRGVESRGMLCSGAELELFEDSDGILDLPADAPVGASYAAYAKLGDPLIEIALTPNRPDCMGVRGIARDLAAAGLGEFIDKTVQPVAGEFPCPVAVKIEDQKLCPAFGLRLIKGVKNGPSPEWLQQRLRAIGLRPINALVDITNYITFDRSRPLHVFDADKVKGNLTVRAAMSGEKLTALDKKTYALDPSMCVIADEKGVLSLAGIMGGEATGCDEKTKSVLIESALWDPLNIAQTGRKLMISSDARYRFERGVDPNDLMPGLEFATQMALDLCGGKASQIAIAGAIPDDNRVIHFSPGEVQRLTGAHLPPYETKLILKALGFWISGSDDEWRVSPPSWRPDIAGKADLVEEVIRIAGLDRVPATPLPRPPHVAAPVLTLGQKRRTLAQRMLGSRGFVEAVTWSFISEAQARQFGGGKDELKLANPISLDMAVMRPSLLPGLLASVKHNIDRGFPDLALFEVGQVFAGDKPEDQKTAAAALRANLAKPAGSGRHWSRANAVADVFNAKADCFALLSGFGAAMDSIQVTREAPAWFHPGRSGTARLGPIVLAHFGDIHPMVLGSFGIEGTLAGFEAFLDALPAPKAKTSRTKAKLQLSQFQPVKRDFAFILDDSVAAANVIKAARGADKALISSVSIFDLYQGKGIAEGKKSLAIEVTLQPREKTLTDAEIEAVTDKIIAQITKATGASLRT